MSNGNSPLTPYARNVQQGLAVANRRMMHKAGAFGYSLVIGTPDGHCYEKDARELMEELSKTNWWSDHFDE